MSEKERFQISCAEAANYPKNLVYHDTYDHILKGYIDRLDEQADRLFFDESKASLSVRDYDADLNVFENITLCSDESVQDYFNGGQLQGREDPQCRLVLAFFNCVLFEHVFREFAKGDKYSFVYAPHSRERLRTTRQMLMFVLTYHQVIPSFLDFLFPFGRQLYAQDSQFSGFRHEERLSVDERGSTLPELGRSGRDFRICYNLKSVEPSKGQKHWPWSTRQTAVYHSFDIETGKSICVIVKGDQLIKKRMEAATKPGVTSTRKPFSSLTASFSSCLAVHLVIFDWSREHWRWFINFLEEELQKSTRQTLLVDLDRGPGRAAMSSIQGPVQRITSSQIYTSPTSISEKSPWRSNSLMKGLPSYSSQPKKLAPLSPPAITSSFGESQESLNSGDDFSFSDLQGVQDLEEKTNGALLVLESNINILSEVKQYYESIIGSDDFPKTIKLACARDITKFMRTTDGIINDLRMQSSRTKMLLRLLTDRKSLLYGILDYRNMESNKLFASKAQLSTENMELMTEDMHEIAQKTQQETVSMRIITLVTLFFLPGTFISTIMSTDIVQYQVGVDGNSHKIFQLGALQLYLAITLPMMFLTFAAWYGVYFFVDRKEKIKILEKRTKVKV